MAMFTPAQKPRGLARITCIMWVAGFYRPLRRMSLPARKSRAASDKRPITTYLSFDLNRRFRLGPHPTVRGDPVFAGLAVSVVERYRPALRRARREAEGGA